MFIQYKDKVIDLKKIYYVDCGFFSEKICFILWEDLIAFMSKTVGFDYSIKTVDVDSVPEETYVYIPIEPSSANRYARYKFETLSEIKTYKQE